ncbi:MAG: MFS transporter [Candidatus Margulisiibacteriota bacterium]
MNNLIHKIFSKYSLIVAAFAFSIFFVRFDGYIVNLAMPTFVSYFKLSISQTSWIALSYILSQVSAIIFFGKISDKFALKKVFLWGIAFFSLSSFLCGIAPGFYFLIAARCLQGISGSMMLVSAYAAMMQYLPKEKLGWGLGIMTTAAALGVLLGPAIGGFIIQFSNWHWIFFINIPLGALAIIYCLKIVPHLPKKEEKINTQFDITGLIFSVIALFLLIFTINMGGEYGWFSKKILTCELFTVIFFVAFYFNEKKSKDPIFDIKLFNNFRFSLVILSAVFGFFLFFGGNFLLPFYLTQKGLTPKDMGILLTIFSLVYIPIGFYAGSLSDKISSKTLVSWAMFFATITGFTFSLLLGFSSVIPVVLYLIMLAVSYGLFFSPINHLLMNFAGENNKGSVSAVYNASLNISMALGVVFLETIYSEFNVSGLGFRVAYFTAACCCFAVLLILIFGVSKNKELPSS